MGSRQGFARDLKRKAYELGFDACGLSKVKHLHEQDRFLQRWLACGRHGTMHWMERNKEKRVDPAKLVPGAQSIVSVLQSYYQPTDPAPDPETGRISRYAWGDDYHTAIKEKLSLLLKWIDAEVGPVKGRTFVDSAPIMDKVWAQRAGLGWIGKHTNLISPDIGSWCFIGELVIDLELPPDTPAQDHCGSCTRCVDACPTGAIHPEYQLDARRCISYLTIEHREDDIPADLSSSFGNWIFGCDICQEVCPWNKFRKVTREPRYHARSGIAGSTIETWEGLDEKTFARTFSDSAVKRTGYSGFKRNVRFARKNLSTQPKSGKNR